MIENKILYIGAWMLTMSVVVFAMYGIDKWKAKRHSWRISEKMLLLLSFFGGVVGAVIAMQLFHHKTKKWYFWAVNVCAIVFWCTICVGVLYF